MVVLSDLNDDRFLFPESYSEEGFRARCAAHRTQVRLALEAGLPVPDEVLDRYRIVRDGDDPPRAPPPWTPEDQNGHAHLSGQASGPEISLEL
jgi:hypothetical protein